MKNIELKAKYPNQKAAMVIAENLGAKYEGILEQEDIYFKISPAKLKERLKLRIINKADYELIYYKRANLKSARESEYEIFKVRNGMELLNVLKSILLVISIIKKKREVYIFENVRIHIDTVKGLGKFIEFEAVCRNKKEIKDAQLKLKKLVSEFNISTKNLIKMSYSDLITNKKIISKT